jgi:hypothetical protein
MWVALEHASSRRLDILSREYNLLNLSLSELWNEAEGINHRSYVGLGFNVYYKQLWATSHVSHPFIYNLRKHTYSFGTALEAISTRQYRSYRDRFIAICGFLPAGLMRISSPSSQMMPPKPACGWLGNVLRMEIIRHFYCSMKMRLRYLEQAGLLVMNRWGICHGAGEILCRLQGMYLWLMVGRSRWKWKLLVPLKGIRIFGCLRMTF